MDAVACPLLACLDKLCFCGVIAQGRRAKRASLARVPWIQVMGDNSVKTKFVSCIVVYSQYFYLVIHILEKHNVPSTSVKNLGGNGIKSMSNMPQSNNEFGQNTLRLYIYNNMLYMTIYKFICDRS